VPAALAASAGLVLVIAVALAFRASGGAPTLVDSWWHDLLASNRSAVVEAIARALNVVGGTLVMTLVTAALVLVLLLARRWHAAIIVGVTVPLASGAHSLLKLLVERPRPQDALLDLTTTSFPSGHTTTAASIAVALVLSLAITRAWAWALAAAWILAMAFSRTYLLVHWMTDVASGALLGASIAVLVALATCAFLPSLNPRSSLV
jgi:undecaprenyl-diphosphatase